MEKKMTQKNVNKDIMLCIISLIITSLCLLVLWWLSFEFWEHHINCVMYCDSINDSNSELKKDESTSCPIKLNTNLHDVYYVNIYGKYKNISKRKIFWYICVKSKGHYTNYTEFKNSWNPNTDILYEIKNQLKSEIRDELHKFNVAKRSLLWFFKGSKPGGGRGL